MHGDLAAVLGQSPDGLGVIGIGRGQVDAVSLNREGQHHEPAGEVLGDQLDRCRVRSLGAQVGQGHAELAGQGRGQRHVVECAALQQHLPEQVAGLRISAGLGFEGVEQDVRLDHPQLQQHLAQARALVAQPVLYLILESCMVSAVEANRPFGDRSRATRSRRFV